MFIKICGITRLEDAQAAVECGADALGFVFWPQSPRLVDTERVRTIVAALRGSVAFVGVFVNQPVEEVNDVAKRAGLTMVQLHGDERPSYAKTLSLPVIKSVTLETSIRFDEWPREVLWLIDAHDPEHRGGTGKLANWTKASALAAERRVLLAGGLTPANVAGAVAQVRPYGIDVSSGVESEPGIKDRALLEALFENIHASHNR
jgi:phosphoribosylanthranilate isomerase